MDWKKDERPLSEWTLAEVKEFCKGRTADEEKTNFECAGCPFRGKVCSTSPDDWRIEA